MLLSLHENLSVPLRISSVNVTKSVVSKEFGRIYLKKLNGKFNFYAVFSDMKATCEEFLLM